MSHIKLPTQTKRNCSTPKQPITLLPKRIRTTRTNSIIFFHRLKVIQNNPHTENKTKEQHDIHLENQNKKSTTTKNNTKKLDQNIPQKRKKK